MSVLDDPKLEALLDTLHAQSAAQEPETNAYFSRRIKEGTLSWDGMDAETTGHFRDKMVALEKEKAEYCYLLCRALRATRVVECGTSFGVSTLYLAAAIRDNLASAVGEKNPGGGEVIATEWEPEKAKAARQNFAAAGLSQYIDLREGDLAETLKTIGGPVDFVLFDIWTEAIPPALRNIAPHLRPGSIMVADNTTQSRRGYEKYFAYIADPKNNLRTMTVPFGGGLELTVRV